MMKAYSFFIRWYWLSTILAFVFFFAMVTVLRQLQVERRIIWGIVLAISIPQSIVMYVGSKRRAKEFYPPEGAQITFSDDRASGYSNSSKVYPFLMAKHALNVKVSSDTVYVRPRFAGRGDLYKEFHMIRIRDVTSAQKAGEKLRLAWGGEMPGDFTLILAQPDEFLASIHRTSLGTPLLS